MKNIDWTEIALVIIFLLVGLFGIPTICRAQNYERQGTMFVSKGTSRTKIEPVKTKYTWKDTKGNKYPIYVSSTGSCFVIRVSSKTGKEYKNYLGPEISQQVCKELGIEYKGKKGN